MGWTPPKLWKAGEKLVAADLNKYLRDNLNAVDDHETWTTSWTPTLTGSVSNPDLGSGSATTGRWIQVGNLLIGTVRWQWGTGGTAGSGDYTVDIPTGTIDTSLLAASANMPLGPATFRAAGTVYIGYIATGTNTVLQWRFDSRTTNGRVGSAAPGAFGTSADYITSTFQVRLA